MGVAKEQKNAKKERRYKGAATQAGNVADWQNVDTTILVWAICVVALAGGALRFGYTRDGGAYAIGVYGDGEPYTEYIKPGEDVNAVIRAIGEAFA